MTRPFSAWTEGALLYGILMIIGMAVLAGTYWVVGTVFLVLGLFTAFFFRDPPRTIKAQPGEVVSPADGTIVAVEDLPETPYYSGPCKRISIFLSVFNVHVNRAPMAGSVEAVAYKPGQYLDARKSETSDCNASNRLDLATDFGPMTVRQISGAIARRIICRTQVGDLLSTGEKYGMIRFGSRTELYLPIDAEVCVKVKDKVQAGTTIMARFRS